MLLPNARRCPGCPLYKDMAQTVVRAMRAAGPNARLRGMLWVQGESDANNDWNAAAYGARFAAFLAAVRQDFAPYMSYAGAPAGGLPVVMAVMSTWKRADIFPYIQEVRGAWGGEGELCVCVGVCVGVGVRGGDDA